jgi:hypothetical protein
MEQDYFNRKRWLLNRLGLGHGILFGLNVTRQDDNLVVVERGVAIDDYGREIIVPNNVSLDPWHLTDENGQAVQDLHIEGNHSVEIYLVYDECATDFTPMTIAECNSRGQCAPNTIKEVYRLLVYKEISYDVHPPTSSLCEALAPGGEISSTLHSAGSTINMTESDMSSDLVLNKAASAESGIRVESLAVHPITPSSQPITIREALCDYVSTLPDLPKTKLVKLAVVSLQRKANGTGMIRSVESCGCQQRLYSNEMLLEMILCNAERIAECCDVGAQQLEIAHGNNQKAPVGSAIKDLAVKVLRNNQPVKDSVDVTFEVIGNSGGINNSDGKFYINKIVVKTTDGIATLKYWRLGTVGANLLLASIVEGSPAERLLFATGQPQPEQTKILKPILATDGQEAEVGANVPLPIQVQVLLDGKPHNGEKVTFKVVEGGGRIGKDQNHPALTAVETTGLNGIATLPIWKLGLPGQNKVKASIKVDDREDAYTFTAIAKPPSGPPVTAAFTIKKVEFLGPDGKVIDPPLNLEKKEALLNTYELPSLRITFNRPVDIDSMKTIGSVSNDGIPYTQENASFTVSEGDIQLTGAIQQIPGSETEVCWNPMRDDHGGVIKIDGTPYVPKCWHVIAYGDTENNRLAICDKDHNHLDGNRDNLPGGNFQFTVDFQSPLFTIDSIEFLDIAGGKIGSWQWDPQVAQPTVNLGASNREQVRQLRVHFSHAIKQETVITADGPVSSSSVNIAYGLPWSFICISMTSGKVFPGYIQFDSKNDHTFIFMLQDGYDLAKANCIAFTNSNNIKAFITDEDGNHLYGFTGGPNTTDTILLVLSFTDSTETVSIKKYKSQLDHFRAS